MNCPHCNGPIIMRPRSDGLFDFGCHHCGKRADLKQAVKELKPLSTEVSDLTADTLELFPGSEASLIGRLYRQARINFVDSVKLLIECGERLKAQKDKLSHGEWTPWLEANENELGFGDRTARMLMDAASRPFSTKRKLASDLTEEDALAVSRQIWGHREPEPGKPYSANSKSTGNLDDSEPAPDWEESPDDPEPEPKQKKSPPSLKPILDLPPPKKLDANPRRCSASCCPEGSEIAGPWNIHDAQALLDDNDFRHGFFREYHAALLKLFVEVYLLHAVEELRGSLPDSALLRKERRYRGIGQGRN